MKGWFITLEGVEGCGKSTQLLRLKHWLESQGRKVLVTREPGGTAIGEAIRRVLLDPANDTMAPLTELLLYQAARAQHIAERIRPALDQGMVVLCDRFADSTTAYQGAGRALPEETVATLHALTTDGLWPDLTIVLDVPPEVGLARARRVDSLDRLEQEPLEFHGRVRQAFLRLAEQEPDRVKVVDGTKPIDEVSAAVTALVATALSSA